MASEQKELRPKFLDVIENGWASDKNPTRTGYFIRSGTRGKGMINPGKYLVLTDGKGNFWEISTKNEKLKIIGNLLASTPQPPATKPFRKGSTFPVIPVKVDIPANRFLRTSAKTSAAVGEELEQDPELLRQLAVLVRTAIQNTRNNPDRHMDELFDWQELEIDEILEYVRENHAPAPLLESDSDIPLTADQQSLHTMIAQLIEWHLSSQPTKKFEKLMADIDKHIRHYQKSAALLDRVEREVIGEDDVLTKDEADGKCEDIGTNVNAYIKEAKNGLRARQRQKLSQIKEEL
jgi:hypothetical protein